MNAHSIINRIAAGALAVVVALGGYFLVPPPQRAAASFEGSSGWGGTAGGSANALTLNIANVQSFGDLLNVTLRFNPAANSTGPVTLAVGGLAPTAVLRPSSLGLVAFSLNEFLTGETTSVFYNGSVFVLASNVDMQRIGSTCEFRGAGAPRGCLIEDGSCVSSTQFSALASVLGTLYGTCSGGSFHLPDSRGTDFMAFDNQGANGAANRITTANCPTPNTPVLCGTETKTISVSEIPSSIPFTGATSGAVGILSGNSLTSGPNTGGSLIGVTAPAAIGTVPVSGTAGGSGSAMPILSPKLPGIRAIKY